MFFRDWFKKQTPAEAVLQIGLALGAFCFFLLMIVYAYQGWFTRYMADDYCNAVMFSNDAIGGLAQRYISGWGGDRYSNIWLVGISEFFGIKSVRYLPMIHIAFWVAGLIWVMAEVRKLVNIYWSPVMTSFLGLSIAFFILVQAPNLYQIVYWRSSMTTHFAPVVYGTFLIAFLFRLFYIARTAVLPAYFKWVTLITAFIVGGFSEPADAVQVTLLVLCIFAIWLWGAKPVKGRALTVLFWTLAGALLSLAVMLFSPANVRRLGDPPPVPQLLHEMFYYGVIFIKITLIELPLPSILSLLVPGLLFGAYSLNNPISWSIAQKKTVWIFIMVSPFLMYLLIVASFSPSVYGQGYPVERVQFYARVIMTLTFLLDGALFGILFSQSRVKVILNRPVAKMAISTLFLLISVIYPFRAALKANNLIPEYAARAVDWDKRDEFIRLQALKGITDLVVPQFNGVDGTKELDTYGTHWVNTCAAKFYGVRSIRAIPMPDQFIDEFYKQ